MTTFLPFGWESSSSVIIAEGHVPVPGESVVSPNELFVTAGYLDALGVPLMRGRLFADSDTEKSPPVIILDEQLARRFWPGQDAIGRRVIQTDQARGCSQARTRRGVPPGRRHRRRRENERLD